MIQNHRLTVRSRDKNNESYTYGQIGKTQLQERTFLVFVRFKLLEKCFIGINVTIKHSQRLLTKVMNRNIIIFYILNYREYVL